MPNLGDMYKYGHRIFEIIYIEHVPPYVDMNGNSIIKFELKESSNESIKIGYTLYSFKGFDKLTPEEIEEHKAGLL